MKTNCETNMTNAAFNMAHSTEELPSKVLFNPDCYDDSSAFWHDMNHTIKALVNNGYDIIVWQQRGTCVISYDFSEDEESRFSACWIPREDEEIYIVADQSEDVTQSSVNKEEISRCPICHCTANPKLADNGKWYMDCCYCPLETAPIFETKNEAIDYWNDRE